MRTIPLMAESMKTNKSNDDRAVLGFSLRDITRSRIDSIWTPESRHAYLLDETIALPITADALMLPEAVKVEPQKAENGEWHINPAGLFARLAGFEKFAAGIPASRNHLRIAVTLPLSVLEELSSKRGFPDDPGTLDDEATLQRLGWRLLGFDSLDAHASISGLVDCGYDDKNRWSNQFRTSLNAVGLFENFEDASRFSSLRSMALPKHAPFMAAGILVKDSLPEWKAPKDRPLKR